MSEQPLSLGEASPSCDGCGEQSPTGSNWCEACGAALAGVPDSPSGAGGLRCGSCDTGVVGSDNYCLTCGYRRPHPDDHQQMVGPGMVAICDRGLRRHENQDAAAVGSINGAAIIVVCDGVASTPDAARLAKATAQGVRDSLVGALGAGHEPQQALVAAIGAAHPESSSVGDHLEPPSTTVVAAVIEPTSLGGSLTKVTVGWLGDSRAYWVASDGARQLTVDHEQGGALDRWVGADRPQVEPDVVSAEMDGSGYVVLCSDGLWKYADNEVAFAQLVNSLLVEAETLQAVGAGLVGFALKCGGHDNVTVGLWETSPSPRAQRGET